MSHTTNESSPMAAAPRALALRLLGPLAAVCLFSMMALTFVGVVARYFFNAPIAGVEEIQAFLLGFIIFSGVPLVTYHQRHIAVRAFAAMLKGRALFAQRVFVLAMTGFGFAFMGYLLYLQGDQLQEEGTLSTFLQIPEAPFAFIFAALMEVAAIVAFALLIALLRGQRLAEAYEPTDIDMTSPD
ncbi:MAG TPA: TRAP transporter small permease [Stellaceae bacterium]|jgi:TRAP-type C4-dicarboxylate transport system permease small subunit|nr:TRAP transporter small permease [Stellaceae bacterium]